MKERLNHNFFVSVSQFFLSQMNQKSRMLPAVALPCFTNHGFGGDNRNYSRPLSLWLTSRTNSFSRKRVLEAGFVLKYSVCHIRKMLANNWSQK